MYNIVMHSRNQHGYAVSLTKHKTVKRDGSEEVELEFGFTLNTFKTVYEQQKYALELSELTGFVLEHM